jgi:aryl-alcohol dehydrogenase-like predicted oxidoreductase
MTAQEMPCVTLGGTSIEVSPIGLGTWAWGDTLVWSYGRGYSDDDIRDAFNVSLNAGITLIDTAEVYGNGKSESWIGRFLKDTDIPTVIATKFMPYPWRFTGRSLRSSLTRSLKRLQLE